MSRPKPTIILEHINKRVLFLKKIIENSKCKKLLIRVPCFERSWEIPMRKKLNINFFSDNDHKIEHTIEELKHELTEVNLSMKETISVWGEIWTKCEYEI